MESSNPGTSGVKIMTRRYLYDKMQLQDLPNLDEKLNYLENYLLICYGDTPDNISSLKQRFAYFKTSIKEKWSKAHRKEAVFLKTNEKVILETISSGHKIDIKKIDKYAMATARLYCDLYGWHPMTPTMHKILIHGAEIIENALLPIGQLSEEAAEARNKHFRLYRENYARKFSREHCNLNVYNRLLLSSDPLLSSIRQTKRSINSKSFCPETINMLLPAEPNTESDISEAKSEE